MTNKNEFGNTNELKPTPVWGGMSNDNSEIDDLLSSPHKVHYNVHDYYSDLPDVSPWDSDDQDYESNTTQLEIFSTRDGQGIDRLHDFAQKYHVLNVKVLPDDGVLVLYDEPYTLQTKYFYQECNEQLGDMGDRVNSFCSKHDVVSIKPLHDSDKLVNVVVYKSFKQN